MPPPIIATLKGLGEVVGVDMSSRSDGDIFSKGRIEKQCEVMWDLGRVLLVIWKACVDAK